MTTKHIQTSLLYTFLCSEGLYALDNCKVLPEGVRSVLIKNVNTDISEKTNRYGTKEALAKPLHKDLTFKHVVNGETGLKKLQLEGFLGAQDFLLAESLGTFSADMAGKVSVTAPVMTYGFSEKLTLAVGIPYYRANMAVAVGFHPSAKAQDFVNALNDPRQNQTESAIEAADKINHAVRELNQKLSDNGYKSLNNWSGSGFGDMTVAAKYRLYQDESGLRFATTNGLILPTGHTDHPDILHDIPFGDGSYDYFTQWGVDMPLTKEAYVNTNAKYTYQFAASREARLITPEETIEVEKQSVDYKLGDKFDYEIGLHYEGEQGLVLGSGYVVNRKYADDYRNIDQRETENELEKNTDQLSHYGELRAGYSGVPAYMRKEIPVPFQVSVDYKKHLSSENMPAGDLYTLDMMLFF